MKISVPEDADGRAEDPQARVDLGGEQQPRADMQREAARQRGPRAGQQAVQAAVDGIDGALGGSGAIAVVGGGGGRTPNTISAQRSLPTRRPRAAPIATTATAMKMTLALMSTASR